jgi:hypothetical protein
MYQLWISFSSITLAFVFVFGNSLRTVFESVIWLFMVHPFDVGDTILWRDDLHKVGAASVLLFNCEHHPLRSNKSTCAQVLDSLAKYCP